MGTFFRHHFPYVWSHLIFNGTIDHFLGQLWSSSVTQQWWNDLLLISYVCFVSGANTLTDLQVQKKRTGRSAACCTWVSFQHSLARYCTQNGDLSTPCIQIRHSSPKRHPTSFYYSGVTLCQITSNSTVSFNFFPDWHQRKNESSILLAHCETIPITKGQ